MSVSMRGRLLCAVAGTCLSVGGFDVASAADETVDTGVDTDIIVITARRIEELAQDVPISVSTLSRETLLDMGGGNIDALSSRITNFTMAPTQGRQSERPTIRGQANIVGEPNASFYLDGFYISARSAASTINSAGLERVEIARGPQSSLYGRSAFSGAINFVTRSASRDLQYGSFARLVGHGNGGGSDHTVSFNAQGPLFDDRLGFALVLSQNHTDGEWRNALASTPPSPLYPGAPTRGDTSRLGEQDSFNVFAKIEFQPTPNAHLSLAAHYIDADDGHYPFVFFGRDSLNCQLPVSGGVTVNSPGYICGEIDMSAGQSIANIPDIQDGLNFFTGLSGAGASPGNERRSARFMGIAEFDFSGWMVSLRGSHVSDNHVFAEDSDRTGQRISAAVIDKQAEDSTFEVRLASPMEARWRGVIGAYAFDQSFTDQRRALFSGFRPRATVDSVRNTAIFGSLEHDLSMGLTATVEARYASDEIEVAGNQASESFESFTPRFTLRFEPSDDAMVYTSVAQGAKPGGFNAVYFDADTHVDEQNQAITSGRAFVDEERAWTFEAGTKLRRFSGRLEIDAAVFFIDWRDQQLTSTVDVRQADLSVETHPILVNIGRSEVTGIDLALRADLGGGWDWMLNYGLASSKIVRGNDPEHAALTGIDDPGYLLDGNLSGNTLPKTPEHSVFSTLGYRTRINATTDWFAQGEVLYESRRYAQVHNFLHTGDRTNVNVRAGLIGENWTLAVFAENIFDDDTPLNIQRYRDFSNGYGPAGRTGVGSNPLWRGFSVTPQPGARFGVSLTISTN
jgi:iron complex outermembrane receptor protein